MISYIKICLFVFLMSMFSFAVEARDVHCYKLVSTSDTKIKTGGYQFITFTGNQCYESNSNGVKTGGSILKKNDFQSDYDKAVYNGKSFCGSNSKMEFTFGKKNLYVSSKGKWYKFVEVTPPDGVETCSYLGTSGSGGTVNYYSGNSYTPSYDATGGTSNNNGSYSGGNSHSSGSSGSTKRKCSVCRGQGTIKQYVTPTGNLGFDRPEKRCPDCGEWYDPDVAPHIHTRCLNCHGTGWVQ